MSKETPSVPEEHGIQAMTVNDLRAEADRLLALYHTTKDPDEMLDLSTRYTKIDMLVDQREAQAKMKTNVHSATNNSSNSETNDESIADTENLHTVVEENSISNDSDSISSLPSLDELRNEFLIPDEGKPTKADTVKNVISLESSDDLAEGVTDIDNIEDIEIPVENSDKISIEDPADVESEITIDNAIPDFENALASLTAALAKSPVADTQELTESAYMPKLNDTLSDNSQDFNSDDDLMEQLSAIEPESPDVAFDIDNVPDMDETGESDTNESLVEIVMDDAIEIGNVNIVGRTTPLAGLDNIPLPSLAPFSGQSEIENNSGVDILDIPVLQKFDTKEEINLSSHLPISTDTTPPSISENSSKLTSNDAQRVCVQCGQITSLTGENCESCSYTDASLGILSSVIAGHTEQVTRLLNAKPVIVHTVTSKHGWTLLHMAASGGNAGLVNLLLQRGCNVNIQNIYGKTALHYAASKGHVKVVTLLLNSNADHTILFEEKTALEHAIEGNQQEVAKILKIQGTP